MRSKTYLPASNPVYISDIRIRSRFRTHRTAISFSVTRASAFWKKKEKDDGTGSSPRSPVRRKSKVHFLNEMHGFSLSATSRILSCGYPLSAYPCRSGLEKADVRKEVDLFEWEILDVSRGPGSFPLDSKDVLNSIPKMYKFFVLTSVKFYKHAPYIRHVTYVRICSKTYKKTYKNYNQSIFCLIYSGIFIRERKKFFTERERESSQMLSYVLWELVATDFVWNV